MSSSDWSLNFPLVKTDFKWHAQITSFTQMLSNQRLLEIRVLSKAVTEAGHFVLILLLAALKRASDPIMKMMLDRWGTLGWVLLNLSGQCPGTAAGIKQQQATSQTGLLEGRIAHSLQVVNRETRLNNSSSLPKPNVRKTKHTHFSKLQYDYKSHISDF